MLLKLTRVDYRSYEIYEIGDTIIVDTTGALIEPTTRVFEQHINRWSVKCSVIMFADGRKVCVKETVSEIWDLINHNKG